MSLAVRCLARGAKLPAFNLMQSGDVSSIRVHAFAAGKLKGGPGGPPRVAERMAASAVEVLRQASGPPMHPANQPMGGSCESRMKQTIALQNSHLEVGQSAS